MSRASWTPPARHGEVSERELLITMAVFRVERNSGYTVMSNHTICETRS